MKLKIFLALLPFGIILSSYVNRDITSESERMPKRVDAKFEGIYNPLKYVTYEFDTLQTQMKNTTISFCGDTIIINGNIKRLFSRRTVATKNIFRQNTAYQDEVYRYFGARKINLRDSVDYLLLEPVSEIPDGSSTFIYTRPGIIYERPYLLIPFHGNYMISYTVEIEPTKYNRLMPYRRNSKK